MPTNPLIRDPIDEIPSGPFLGRRIELESLCRAVEEARLGGGARFWVVGPVGIGKSRLLAEIAQYAGWRHIPVDFSDPTVADSAAHRFGSRLGPSLLIVDPVASAQVTRLDEQLRCAAENPTIALATATSAESCLRAGIPENALIAIDGLDPADSLRLLRAYLGSAFDLAWARRTARSTRGRPGQMREAAANFLETRRGGRTQLHSPSPDGR
jgi:hypothetical protein